MHWKTYRSLTPEQKEEYNYRFKDVEGLTFSTQAVLNLLFLTVVIIFLSYICVMNPAFSQYVPYITKWLSLCGAIVLMCGVIMIIYAAYDVIRLAIHIVEEMRWRKKEGIKGW